MASTATQTVAIEAHTARRTVIGAGYGAARGGVLHGRVTSCLNGVWCALLSRLSGRLIMSPSSRAADILIEHLERWGVRTVFAVPGAHVDPLLIELVQSGAFELVVATHEQGAGYMADGHARMSGRASVAASNSGPGATNMVTAAVTARLDHVPVLFLTGDTPSAISGMGGFQSGDDSGTGSTSVLRAALGHSHTVRSIRELEKALVEIDRGLLEGVIGPRHLCVPVDLVLEEPVDPVDIVIAADAKTGPSTPDAAGARPPEPPALRGPRMMLLVGEQIAHPQHMERIAALAVRFQVPVACTLGAKQALAYLPSDLQLGVFGYAGSPRAFHAVLKACPDVVHAIGIDLDERSTAAWNPSLLGGASQLLHWTCEASRRISGTDHVTPLVARDVGELLSALERCFETSPINSAASMEARQQWIRSILGYPIEPPDTAVLTPAESGTDPRLGMAAVVRLLRQSLPDDAVLFLDSGDHRIYAGHYWMPTRTGRFFSSAASAPMGWAICAAIGASFCEPERPVWALTGDGCMMMHGLELATAARYRRKVKLLVSNNGSYGRIAARLKGQSAAVRDALSRLAPVSWCTFAASLGVPSARVAQLDELPDAVERARATSGPFLVEIMTSVDAVPPFPPAVFSSCTPDMIRDFGPLMRGKRPAP